MDRITKKHRSWNMSRIRSKNTKPEIVVRSLLHKLGYRFRLHVGRLPGRPDIVLRKWHTVVFVHGCFWHRHRACKFAYTPKTRRDFWARKFARNVAKDVEALKALRLDGWNVVTVWECQTRDLNRLARQLLAALAHSRTVP